MVLKDIEHVPRGHEFDFCDHVIQITIEVK